MPKLEFSPTQYRLEALATKTTTVEMMVNRAVDAYLQVQTGPQKKGPRIQIPPKPGL